MKEMWDYESREPFFRVKLGIFLRKAPEKSKSFAGKA